MHYIAVYSLIHPPVLQSLYSNAHLEHKAIPDHSFFAISTSSYFDKASWFLLYFPFHLSGTGCYPIHHLGWFKSRRHLNCNSFSRTFRPYNTGLNVSLASQAHHLPRIRKPHSLKHSHGKPKEMPHFIERPINSVDATDAFLDLMSMLLNSSDNPSGT